MGGHWYRYCLLFANGGVKLMCIHKMCKVLYCLFLAQYPFIFLLISEKLLSGYTPLHHSQHKWFQCCWLYSQPHQRVTSPWPRDYFNDNQVPQQNKSKAVLRFLFKMLSKRKSLFSMVAGKVRSDLVMLGSLFLSPWGKKQPDNRIKKKKILKKKQMEGSDEII